MTPIMQRANRLTSPTTLTASDWVTALTLADLASPRHAQAILRAVAATDQPDVTRTALAHRMCPPDALAAATDRHLPSFHSAGDLTAFDLLIAIAWNPATPASALDALAASPSSDLRLAVTFNPTLTATQLDALLADATVDIVVRVAAHPNTSPQTLTQLSAEPDTAVRDAVLANPNTPAMVIRAILGTTPDAIRLNAAARNRALDPRVIARWAHHERSSVRRVAAANPALPPESMPALAWSGDDRTQVTIARQPLLPADLAEALSGPTSATATRRALAANTGIPVAAIGGLLVDPDPHVRSLTVTSRPDLPGSLLAQVAVDEMNTHVRAALLAHPNLPDRVTLHLLNRATPAAFSALAVTVTSRPGPLSAPLIAALHAGEPSPGADKVYARPECPSDLLAAAAAGDRGPRARLTALVNPNLADVDIAAAASSGDLLIRLLAATRPTAAQQ
jgi:hypothetical protein